MRYDCIVDAITSVDCQRTVKVGGKVTKFCEGVIYRGKFEVTIFRNSIEKLFILSLKAKDEKKR